MRADSLKEEGLTSIIGPMLGGTVIAAAVCVLMFNFHPVWVFLIAGGMLAVIPTFVVKDIERYWLTLFLAFLAFDVKKTLLDGLKVQAALNLDSFVAVLVPDIQLSDLALVVLLLMWLMKILRGDAQIHIPASAFLFMGYFVFAAMSVFGAPSAYLVGVQLLRDLKWLIIFLYVVNNFDIKRWVPAMGLVMLSLVVLEGSLSFIRYRFQFLPYLGGSAFGRVTIDTKESKELLVEAGAGTSYRGTGRKRGFGTVNSPAGTAKFFMVLLPWPFLLFLRGPSFRTRVFYFLVFLIGVAGLLATFSRAGIVGLAAVIALGIWFMFRQGYIAKNTFMVTIIAVLGLGLLCSPFINYYLTTRMDNVSVRYVQYEACVLMVLEHPLLGVGLNNSGQALKRYTYSTSGPATDATKVVYKQPIHNFFLALWAEVGIPGFFCFITCFVIVCRKGWMMVKSGSRVKAFYTGIFLVCILGLFTDVNADPLYEDGIIALAWVYAGSILAIARSGINNVGDPLHPAQPS